MVRLVFDEDLSALTDAGFRRRSKRVIEEGSENIISHGPQSAYTPFMSYLTLEVEIDHGKVVPKAPVRLPETGSGLLTIFPSEETGHPRLTPLQALDALQKHLRLDARQAVEWMAVVREARR